MSQNDEMACEFCRSNFPTKDMMKVSKPNKKQEASLCKSCTTDFAAGRIMFSDVNGSNRLVTNRSRKCNSELTLSIILISIILISIIILLAVACFSTMYHYIK